MRYHPPLRLLFVLFLFTFIFFFGWSTNFPQSIKLRDAIKEYEANKWKVIGQKVGKPAKVNIFQIPRCICCKNLTFMMTRLVNNMPKSTSKTSEVGGTDDH